MAQTLGHCVKACSHDLNWNLQTRFGKYKLARVSVVKTVGKHVVKLYAALDNFLDDFFGLVNSRFVCERLFKMFYLLQTADRKDRKIIVDKLGF